MRRLIPNGTDAEKEVLDNADLENLNAMLVEFAVGALPVQRLKACVNALTSW